MVVGDRKVQALMFADDVIVLSQTANGLKRAIDITVRFFENINLSVNFSKSQIMIFNSRGLLLDKNPDYQFYAGSKKLKMVNEYTYLGMKFTCYCKTCKQIHSVTFQYQKTA